ncbi:MAG: ABC transporter ATP-binding protein, partial [Deltaproteobacteria bacterium]|nr:ABC transporter ATP-binding protein [Deltaproteobacteria bacterium]
VIGMNGSGKSTLLKILARITKPTTGRIEIFGQVGSLLEVGTGFHPELTGRENVYLNGAILGMTRREIDEKFDAIVDFSGVEEFLDTPVKRYSSGMQVRLAFSVAAHLDTQVLLLDEVLAVGDLAFQEKSQTKMGSVVRDGRTVVIVSHGMEVVKSLCNSTIVLNRGEMVYAGQTEEAVELYKRLQEVRHADPAAPELLRGVKVVGLKTVVHGQESHHLTPDASLTALMEVHTSVHLPEVDLHLVIEDASGRYVVHHRTQFAGLRPVLEPGAYHVEVNLPKIDLGSGSYRLWTRVNAVSNGRSRWADSEKVPLEVSGHTETLGLLEVPCQWVWHKKSP